MIKRRNSQNIASSEMKCLDFGQDTNKFIRVLCEGYGGLRCDFFSLDR